MEENNNEPIETNMFDEHKIILDNLRISNYTKGQRWITLKGDFTSTELYDIADKIEKSFNKAFNNGQKWYICRLECKP